MLFVLWYLAGLLGCCFLRRSYLDFEENWEKRPKFWCMSPMGYASVIAAAVGGLTVFLTGILMWYMEAPKSKGFKKWWTTPICNGKDVS